MKRILFAPLLTSLLLFSAHCKKKKIEKFAEPFLVMAFESGSYSEIPIVKDINPKSEGIGKLRDELIAEAIAKVSVEGKADGKNYSNHYLEIVCPLGTDCAGKTGYIDVSVHGDQLLRKNDDLDLPNFEKTYVTSMRYNLILFSKLEKDDVVKTRAFLEGRLDTPPTQLNARYLRDYIFRTMQSDIGSSRLATATQLAFIATAKDNKNFGHDIYDSLRRPFKLKKDPPVIISIPEDSKKLIRAFYSLSVDEYVKKFPSKGLTMPILATELNTLSIPFIREKILLETLKTGAFRIEGQVGQLKKKDVTPVETGASPSAQNAPDAVKKEIKITANNFSLKYGMENEKPVQLTIDTLEISAKDIEVISISAFVHENRLAFEVRTFDGILKLLPTGDSTYLLSGGAGLKNYIKQLPSDKELEDAKHSGSFLKASLKYGKVDYDTKSGKIVISVTPQGKTYWPLFATLRNEPCLAWANEKGFGGDVLVDQRDAYSRSRNPIHVWIQPTGAFTVEEHEAEYRCSDPYQYDCKLIKQTLKDTETCFNKEGTYSYEIRINPEDVNSETADFELYFPSSKGICRDALAKVSRGGCIGS